MNAKIIKEPLVSTTLGVVAEKQSFSTPSSVIFTYKEVPVYIVVKYWSTGYNVNASPIIYSAPHGWALVGSMNFYTDSQNRKLFNAGIGDISVGIEWDYQNNQKQVRATIGSTAYRYAYAEVYGIYF